MEKFWFDKHECGNWAGYFRRFEMICWTVVCVSTWNSVCLYSICDCHNLCVRAIFCFKKVKRKMVFQSTRHKIWTYKRKKFVNIFFNHRFSNWIWKKKVCNHFLHYFWMIQSGLSLSKGSVPSRVKAKNLTLSLNFGTTVGIVAFDWSCMLKRKIPMIIETEF
jgi:uncharacterized membrane protein